MGLTRPPSLTVTGGAQPAWVFCDQAIGFKQSKAIMLKRKFWFLLLPAVFGGGGSAEIECEAAAGRDAFGTMFAEFAQAVGQGAPSALDVQRGLHLQRVVEEAQTDLVRNA